MTQSREIRLKSRPAGMPTAENFELATVTVPDPGPGEVLVRNIWMSVDPYMRGRMLEVKSYVPSFQVGQPLEGGAIGQVVKAGPGAPFQVGDYLSHMMGWREAFVAKGGMMGKVDPALAPVQAYLGAFGMPGLTAYAGLFRIGGLKGGERVFVSAASGAVGSIVCQIAKAKGCYVVGSAGSDEKRRWLLETAKIDKAINYKTCGDLNAAVAGAFPEGIDVYFENVGGDHLTAALSAMREHGRVVLCGMIAQYNATSLPTGPWNIILAIPRRLKIEGFVVSDHFDMLGDFLRDMSVWRAEGRMHWTETVVEGIEKAPDAFLGLFRGDNFGKMLVKIGPDPAV